MSACPWCSDTTCPGAVDLIDCLRDDLPLDYICGEFVPAALSSVPGVMGPAYPEDFPDVVTPVRVERVGGRMREAGR